MDTDPAIQQDYKDGVTADAAASAGTQAGQNGSALSPQQANESAEAFQKRQAAYDQSKQQEDKQQ